MFRSSSLRYNVMTMPCKVYIRFSCLTYNGVHTITSGHGLYVSDKCLLLTIAFSFSTKLNHNLFIASTIVFVRPWRKRFSVNERRGCTNRYVFSFGLLRVFYFFDRQDPSLNDIAQVTRDRLSTLINDFLRRNIAQMLPIKIDVRRPRVLSTGRYMLARLPVGFDTDWPAICIFVGWWRVNINY
jgi:hypothetical protein